MPCYCSVYGCRCSSAKNPDLSFFQYPKDAKLFQTWVVQVGKEHFTPTKTSHVCSRHFDESDLYIPQTETPRIFKRRRLRKGAIPKLNLHCSEKDNTMTKGSNTEISETTTTSFVLRPHTSEKSRNDIKCPQSHVASTSAFERSKRAKLTKPLESIAALEKMRFLYRNMTDDDVKNYTGIENSVFKIVVRMLERFSPLNYWLGTPVNSIGSEDQLLILFLRLRLDLPYYDIAKRYSVSQTTIENIVMTYLHALHEIFFVGGVTAKFPSKDKHKRCMAETFDNITYCRVLIDCPDIRITVPKQDLSAGSETYSIHKHCLSKKYVIGVTSNGAIAFVSCGFPGSTNDRGVTNESGIISHLRAGDLILADRGFVIDDLLPKDAFLSLLPVYLCGKTEFTKEEAVASKQTATCRTDVEKAIERLRSYKILDCIYAQQHPFADKIVHVCAVLANLQVSIIASAFQNYEFESLHQSTHTSTVVL